MLQLGLVAIAGVVHIVDPARADDRPNPSAACNPWSANYWGDVVIRSQAEADEYACFRRVVGAVKLVQSNDAPFVLPQLQGVVGSVEIVLSRGPARGHALAAAAAITKMLPALREVSGDLELEYEGAGDDGLAAVLGLDALLVRGDVRLALLRDSPAGLPARRPAAISDATVRR